MKNFPKTLYITRTEPEEDTGYTDYFVQEDKKFVKEEDADTEVAVYQLMKIGKVVKTSKISFE
jgi:hypothetical protein